MTTMIMKAEDDGDNNNNTSQTVDTLYQSAIHELLHSSTHQATTKEAILLSSKRRTITPIDMKYYWSQIVVSSSNDDYNDPSSVIFPPMIHITGTKGKGSTACMCESIMRNHYHQRTGLFTSPHLLDIRERIRINGQPVHPHVFGRVYWYIRNQLEKKQGTKQHSSKFNFCIKKTKKNRQPPQGAGQDDDEEEEQEEQEEDLGPPPILPGYFRMLTLMAMYIFGVELKSHIDVMIIEVGMGGRYDATNFIDEYNNTTNNCASTTTDPPTISPPMVSSPTIVCGVTLLDYDHVRVLGNTLGKIAWEKGGIFAPIKLLPPSLHGPQQQQQQQQRISPRPPYDYTKNNTSNTNDDKAEHDYRHRSRRQCFILDSNPTEVMLVMESCARIEGQHTTLIHVDSKGTRLRQAFNDINNNDDVVAQTKDTFHGSSNTSSSSRERRLGLGLAGDHQYGNATLAIQLCNTLMNGIKERNAPSTMSRQQDANKQYAYPVSVLKALSLAQWPGRCQTLQPPTSSTLQNGSSVVRDGTASRTSPSDYYDKFTFYLDGAHTQQSLQSTVEWFQDKLIPYEYNDDNNTHVRRPILVFNCSHERNPIELLGLLSSSKSSSSSDTTSATSSSRRTLPPFSHVYFTKSDSVRPSAVSPPSAVELLKQCNLLPSDIQMENNTSSSSGDDGGTKTDATTWQETLKTLWCHIEEQSVIKDQYIRCNLTAQQVVNDLMDMTKESSKTQCNGSPIPVFVTGSLYLVGSFLDALGWSEESSPIVNAEPSTKIQEDTENQPSDETATANNVDFLDVDDLGTTQKGNEYGSVNDPEGLSSTTRGTNDGRAAGEAASYVDGWMLGASKGLEIGIEIGFATGLLESARQYIGSSLASVDQSEEVNDTAPSHSRLQRSIDELENAIHDFRSSSTDLFDRNPLQNDTIVDGTEYGKDGDGDEPTSNDVDVRSKLQRVRARCKVLMVQLGIPHHSLKDIMDSAVQAQTNSSDKSAAGGSRDW